VGTATTGDPWAGTPGNGTGPGLSGVVARLAGPAVAPALAARLGEEAGIAWERAGTGPGGPPDDADGPGVLPDLRPPWDPSWDPPRDGGRDDPAARAARPDLTGDEIAALLALDRPDVDARLFTHPRLPDAERARLLAGVRHDGRRGDVPAPLLSVLWGAELGRCRRWLAAGMTSGDVEVALVIVRRLALRTEAGCLRVVTSVWDRHGPDAAGRILAAASFPPATRALVEEALAAPEGLAALRARLAGEEDPARVADALLALGEDHDDHVERVTAEGGTLPWAELVRAHRAAPLPYDLHTALVRQPGCPRELLVDLPGRGLPDPGYDGAPPWLDDLLVRGVLTPGDVLAHARPASVVLRLLAGEEWRTHRSRWAADPPFAEVRAPFAAALGTDIEAWTVALRLLPGFAGSVPELLTTATAAVRAVASPPPAGPRGRG
jgi:hypothetical protein